MSDCTGSSGFIPRPKMRPSISVAGTFDIPIQRTIFGRGLSVRVFEIASRQHANIIFWTTACIFWTAVNVICVLGQKSERLGESLPLDSPDEHNLKPR